MSTRRNHRRLDKIAAQTTQEENEHPWVVYGPEWAQGVQDASPPPDDLSDPVWARGEGWMEKADAPIHKDEGGALALYAPDSMDEVAGPKGTE